MEQNNLDLINYTNWLQERNRTERTIQLYLKILKQFWQHQEITTQNIRNFLKANLTKYQPNSLKLVRYTVSSYAKFAKLTIDWEWLKGIIPKSQRKAFATLSLEELAQLKAIIFSFLVVCEYPS